MTVAVEGAEDDSEQGAQDLKDIQLNDNDIVIGISASGRTPYVKGALMQTIFMLILLLFRVIQIVKLVLMQSIF